MANEVKTYSNRNVRWRQSYSHSVKYFLQLIEAVRDNTDMFTDSEYEYLCEYLLGRSMYDIANKNGVVPNTVGNTLNRAKDKFANAMAEYKATIAENERLKAMIAEKDEVIRAFTPNVISNERTKLLNTPIENYKHDLPTRTYSALRLIGVNTLGDLADYKKSSLAKVTSIGREGIKLLDNLLIANGLKLGMDVKAYILNGTLQ